MSRVEETGLCLIDKLGCELYEDSSECLRRIRSSKARVIL